MSGAAKRAARRVGGSATDPLPNAYKWWGGAEPSRTSPTWARREPPAPVTGGVLPGPARIAGGRDPGDLPAWT